MKTRIDPGRLGKFVLSLCGKQQFRANALHSSKWAKPEPKISTPKNAKSAKTERLFEYSSRKGLINQTLTVARAGLIIQALRKASCAILRAFRGRNLYCLFQVLTR